MKPIHRLIILVIIFTTTDGHAQDHLFPLSAVQVFTMEGTMVKGLLLSVHDSGIIIYPGKKAQWEKKMAFRPVRLHYQAIDRVMLKKTRLIQSGRRSQLYGYFSAASVPLQFMHFLLPRRWFEWRFEVDADVSKFNQLKAVW